MNIEGLEKLLLHPCLTKIGDDGEKPPYTTIKKLRDELISNTVAIPSDFGDGFNGHPFLVVYYSDSDDDSDDKEEEPPPDSGSKKNK